MHFLILLAILLAFAFIATLALALVLLAITFAIITTLASALLLAITIVFAVATILSSALGIALIYSRRFNHIHSPDITAIITTSRHICIYGCCLIGGILALIGFH